jgi:hypothetical protein
VDREAAPAAVLVEEEVLEAEAERVVARAAVELVVELAAAAAEQAAAVVARAAADRMAGLMAAAAAVPMAAVAADRAAERVALCCESHAPRSRTSRGCDSGRPRAI